jgi:UDP-2,3-diacylglucosamine hydrolase
MAQAAPQFAQLAAAADWRALDFISDLHLQESEPATFAAWQRYMAQTPADAVFILGDLFEVWVGDDAALDGSFEARCVDVLRAASLHAAVFFMHGNRDFLAGSKLMAQSRATLLDDPTVLAFAGQRWLLTHGDALCLDDVDYMAFRAEVRSVEWQSAFLAKPLVERQAIARGIRAQSEAKKRSGASYADVDSALAVQWLQAANAVTMIHGHTHKPAAHALTTGLQRVVLSDWDVTAEPPRAQVLRLDSQGFQRLPAL